jgi:transcriptional regulator with XRE-family HTH domain
MGQPYYWWYVYGPFSPGEDNLPCLGEVIAYYLALSGLSTEELAARLHWTVRYIKMLKSSRNKAMSQLLSRRILLAKVLHIPPVLLGLSSVTLWEWGEGAPKLLAEAGIESFAGAQSMQSYEHLLSLAWELYYTSSVQKASQSVEEALTRLNQEFADASGLKRDQYDALRCRFYQLSSLVARDRKETGPALEFANQAVSIALRLKNAELVASSLLRRARVHIRAGAYEQAWQDAKEALPYADLSRDPLKGKCYQMAGEALSYVAGQDAARQRQSLAYFDKAAWIARKGHLEPDGSFVKTDLTSVLIEKAQALTMFGRPQEALTVLGVARKHLHPELTRWELNLLLAEADAYFASGDLESCCYSLTDALAIARSLQLPTKEERILQLYTQCKSLGSGSALRQFEKQLGVLA